MPSVAAKRWMFTTFDASSASFQRLFDLEDEVDYIVCGFMKSPRYHLDYFNVFIMFKRRVRVKFLKDRWPDCEAFKCFCSPYEVMVHCKRSQEFCEMGCPPKQMKVCKRAREVMSVGCNPDKICITLDALSSIDV